MEPVKSETEVTYEQVSHSSLRLGIDPWSKTFLISRIFGSTHSVFPSYPCVSPERLQVLWIHQLLFVLPQ